MPVPSPLRPKASGSITDSDRHDCHRADAHGWPPGWRSPATCWPFTGLWVHSPLVASLADSRRLEPCDAFLRWMLSESLAPTGGRTISVSKVVTRYGPYPTCPLSEIFTEHPSLRSFRGRTPRLAPIVSDPDEKVPTLVDPEQVGLSVRGSLLWLMAVSPSSGSGHPFQEGVTHQCSCATGSHHHPRLPAGVDSAFQPEPRILVLRLAGRTSLMR